MENIAKLIDHTLLRSTATEEEIVKVSEEGLKWGVASVCVHPFWVKTVADVLRGSEVACCSVVGFPLGMNKTETILHEVESALVDGASEIDMVQNLASVNMGLWGDIESQVREIKTVTGKSTLKVILEICELTDDGIVNSCKAAVAGGADFVKTSTGFGRSGATVESVELMRVTVGNDIGVKAAGGIRDYATMKQMLDAGANRIGTSSTGLILEQANMELKE